MREIKFRAWDLQNNEMVTEMYMNASTGKPLVFNIGNDMYHESERWVMMQYTGIYDIDYTPIYDGDIVKYFRNGRFTRKVIVGWQHGRALNGWNISQGEFKVIGNIYEDGDLLNGKNLGGDKEAALQARRDAGITTENT